MKLGEIDLQRREYFDYNKRHRVKYCFWITCFIILIFILHCTLHKELVSQCQEAEELVLRTKMIHSFSHPAHFLLFWKTGKRY
ncbi:hypothetical protein Anas_06621 [Armadillidium nasatum]|uniref:Uncharacterized protein n=1 Tax=Armadillidium nasatum TaxID=96803 RepID=A0A5N5ST86_9CRUS|nr:hypothetical protein Anas_06621 [Armadillidium nasatum]